MDLGLREATSTILKLVHHYITTIYIISYIITIIIYSKPFNE